MASVVSPLRASLPASTSCRPRTAAAPRIAARRTVRAAAATATTFKVDIEHEGKVISLDVPEGESILAAALDKGIDLPHDCKLGVCMTCPAKMISGTVDQSGSMLSDDVAAKGYALLCVAQPRTACRVKTISEDELLDQQFGQ